jgi:hypothetical protein
VRYGNWKQRKGGYGGFTSNITVGEYNIIMSKTCLQENTKNLNTVLFDADFHLTQIFSPRKKYAPHNIYTRAFHIYMFEFHIHYVVYLTMLSVTQTIQRRTLV